MAASLPPTVGSMGHTLPYLIGIDLFAGLEAQTFTEQAKILSHQGGKPIQHVSVSKEAAEQAMKTREWMIGVRKNRDVSQMLDFF